MYSSTVGRGRCGWTAASVVWCRNLGGGLFFYTYMNIYIYIYIYICTLSFFFFLSLSLYIYIYIYVIVKPRLRILRIGVCIHMHAFTHARTHVSSYTCPPSHNKLPGKLRRQTCIWAQVHVLLRAFR